MTDADLLQRYVQDGSSAAFTVLVERHIHLVYSVACRHVGTSAAEDVTQTVFIELVRKARSLNREIPLVAWLHVVTRRIAFNAARAQRRARLREQTAAELAAMRTPCDEWSAIAPVLDEAVASLTPLDRTAILLRFFENKSLREVGAAVCASEDAAQKRVARALEQLRTFLVRRGVTISTAALTHDLCVHAVNRAAPTLCASISSAAISAMSGAASKALLVTFVQKIFPTAAMVLAVSGALFEARAIFAQQSELASLRQDEKTLLERNRLERRKGSELARSLAALQSQPAPIAAGAGNLDPTAAAEVAAWLERLSRLRQLAQLPGKTIPEEALLSEQNWLVAAQNVDFEKTQGLPRSSDDALRGLRGRAKVRFSMFMSEAAEDYVKANSGHLPGSSRELAPYFKNHEDFDASKVTYEMLDRYAMRYVGKLSDVPPDQRGAVFVEITSPDEEHDQRVVFGPVGLRITDFKDLREETKFALRTYADARGSTAAVAPRDLLPYFIPALSPARQVRFVRDSGTLLAH